MVSGAGGYRSVAGIAEDNGVDLVWIVIVFLVGRRGGAGGTISTGGEMYMSGVTQGIEDDGERTGGDNDRKQYDSGVERLAASEIEAGSAECGDAGRQGLLLDGVVLGVSRCEPSWRRAGGVGHTHSVKRRDKRDLIPATSPSPIWTGLRWNTPASLAP